MAALGLLLLVAMAAVALAGIFANTGSGHQLGHAVNILGYHLHGSTGKLLLVGVVVGVVGMLGLNLLLAGIGRGFKRKVSHRKERRTIRRQAEVVVEDRDRLAGQLEREHTARIRAEQRGPTPKEGSSVAAPSALAAEDSITEERGGLLHRRTHR